MFHTHRFVLRFSLALPFVLLVASALMGFKPHTTSRVAHDIAQSVGLTVDPSLNQAAERHARDLLEDGINARWERVKEALRTEGIADAQFWPIALIGGDPEAMGEEIGPVAVERAQDRRATHVGIGVAFDGPRIAMVVLLVRRLVRLSPLPQEPSPRGLVLRGRTDIGQRLEALWMGPCRDTECRGGVRNLRIRPGRRGGWVLVVPAMQGPGTWTLELMVETAKGPEPAVVWRWGPTGALQRPTGEPERWVARFRKREGLDPVSWNRALALAARRHAENVCKSRQAAHIIGSGPSPQHRAFDAGYRAPVTENVAVAGTAVDAHLDILRSPSHRRNVIDPTARDYGMAVVQRPGRQGARPIHCWVEMFGRP